MTKKPTIEHYQGSDEQHRWKLKHGNGMILAASSEGFVSKANAKRNVRAISRALRILFPLALLFLFTGCASTTTLTNTVFVDKNGVTNVVTKASSKYDPLVGKQVVIQDTLFGARIKTAGGSYSAPFEFMIGFGRVRYFSNPTSTNQVYAAPWNESNHGSSSWVSQSANENTSTMSNGLPDSAYQQPSVSPVNPLSSANPQTNKGTAAATNGAAIKQ